MHLRNDNFTLSLLSYTRKHMHNTSMPFKASFKTLFVWMFSIICWSGYAQYTSVINSNRPGFSESPYSVGSGVYQFETSMFYRNIAIQPTFSRPQSLGLNLHFRTSFFSERLEFSANLAYSRDKVAFKNIFTSHYFVNGISDMSIGAKYLIFQQEFDDKTKEIRSWRQRHSFDWKRFIPSVALYAGVNTDVVHEIHQSGTASPKVGLLLQNDLSDDFIIVSNLFLNKMGTEYKEFSYIVTATYSLSDRWSTFFENQGIFTKYRRNNNLGTGLAFLYSRNLQINASARLLVEDTAAGFYTSIGVSYRLNRHQDSFIDTDGFGNPLQDNTPKFNKKKGFFKSIFGIFKKKKN